MSSLYFNALTLFVSLFEELEERYGYKYMLVGGVLTSIYAEARQTQDVDILIQIQSSQESQAHLLDLFKKYKFQPFTSWKAVILDWKTNQFIQVLDPEGIIKLDISIAGFLAKDNSSYEKIKFLALKHRRRYTINGLQCWIQGKEDFVLSKLVFGGYQDYKDALACWIRYNSEIDVSYLAKNAKNLGIDDLYQALTQNASADAIFPDD